MVKWLGKNRILLIFILSTLFILIYKLYLLKLPPIFDGAYELGDLNYNIAIALMTSTIFYYYIVYLKEQNSKKKVEAVINNRLLHLEAMASIIYKDICSKSNHANFPKEIPDWATFTAICSNIKLRDVPPPYWNASMIQFQNWFEYFQYTFALDRGNIDDLFKYSQFINEETLAQFNIVMHTTFHSGIVQYQTSTEEYANEMSSLAGAMLNYLNILKTFKQNSWK